MLLIFIMLMYFVGTMVEGNIIPHQNIKHNHQTHSESTIADQVEIIYPNVQQSLPTKEKTRLKKDPKFLSEQVEVFSKKNQTYTKVPDKFDEMPSDGRPLKFVSSRPLFVYRKEQRKKEMQNYGPSYYGYGNGNDNTYPYPYPFSYYTNHGVFHYYPYGR